MESLATIWSFRSYIDLIANFVWFILFNFPLTKGQTYATPNRLSSLPTQKMDKRERNLKRIFFCFFLQQIEKREKIWNDRSWKFNFRFIFLLFFPCFLSVVDKRNIRNKLFFIHGKKWFCVPRGNEEKFIHKGGNQW